MEGNNNAPFREGQKIVRTGKSVQGIIKGNIYTSEGCIRCPNCNTWHTAIRELPITKVAAKTMGCKCGLVLKGNEIQKVKYYTGLCENFAPIERNQISIEKEVLDSLPKITEERSDVKPQTVNN